METIRLTYQAPTCSKDGDRPAHELKEEIVSNENGIAAICRRHGVLLHLSEGTRDSLYWKLEHWDSRFDCSASILDDLFAILGIEQVGL